VNNLKSVYTRDQAIDIFIATVMPSIIQNECSRGSTFDGPMRREAWNDWTDSLCKANQISDWQYNNWTQPECCEQ